MSVLDTCYFDSRAVTRGGLKISYDMYSKFTMWPPELRSELRAAVASKHRGDLRSSEQYFRK